MIKKFISYLILCIFVITLHGNQECETHECHTILVPRSQSSNTALWGNLECLDGALQITAEYQHTFNHTQIANELFGTDTLLFQGSQLPNRARQALVADYFGLSQTFSGSITCKPSIKNFNINVATFISLDAWLDRWCSDLWLSGEITFAHQSRNLNLCIKTPLTATALFPAGYMDKGPCYATPFLEAALSGDFLFGDMQSPWSFGKFDFQSRTKNGVASIDINTGYNFLNCEEYRFGAFLRLGIPTGTKINAHYAQYIFNPIIGNGHHWEVGGGITADYTVWCDAERDVTAYLDGYVLHLFNNNQVRSFDFAHTSTTPCSSSCLSRYGLLKELQSTSGTACHYSSAQNLINAINFTTRAACVGMALKGDASLRLMYRDNHWNAGVGYNIYGQSHEEVCINASQKIPCGTDLQNTYGLKGCQNSYYYINSTITPLNSTASNATGFCCGSVDYPFEAGTSGSDTTVFSSCPALPINAETDLNPASGATPHLITHKGFAQASYTWGRRGHAPFLGAVIEIEGGSLHHAINQWGIAFQGGFTF